MNITTRHSSEGHRKDLKKKKKQLEKTTRKKTTTAFKTIKLLTFPGGWIHLLVSSRTGICRWKWRESATSFSPWCWVRCHDGVSSSVLRVTAILSDTEDGYYIREEKCSSHVVFCLFVFPTRQKSNKKGRTCTRRRKWRLFLCRGRVIITFYRLLFMQTHL